MIITAGKTNVTLDVYFVDDDGGTAPGEPTTGKLFSDIETGGSASYHRQGAARVDLTLVTQTVAGAHTDGGFIQIDATNMPGLYRVDFPDAAFATGVDYVMIQLVMASANNSIMRPLLIDLTDFDLRDSTPAVNVTQIIGTAPTLTNNDLDVNIAQIIGTAPTLDTGDLEVHVVGFDASAITAASIATDAITAAKIAANAITSSEFAQSAADKVWDTTARILTASTNLNDPSVQDIRAVATGTADSGSSTTMVDAARTEADDVWTGAWLLMTSGSNANESRLITNFVASSATFTVAPAFTAAVSTDTYEILPNAGVDIQSWLGTAAAMVAPNALVSGAVDADVSAIQSAAITAAAIATDAIGAAEISAAAGNKIADHVIRRTAANARASSDGDTVAFRSLLGAVSKLVNKLDGSGANLLVKEEDDATTFGTQAITTNAAADPITILDTT